MWFESQQPPREKLSGHIKGSAPWQVRSVRHFGLVSQPRDESLRRRPSMRAASRWPRSLNITVSAPGSGRCVDPGTSASACDQIAVTRVCAGAGAAERRSSSCEPATSSRRAWPMPYADSSEPGAASPGSPGARPYRRRRRTRRSSARRRRPSSGRRGRPPPRPWSCTPARRTRRAGAPRGSCARASSTRSRRSARARPPRAAARAARSSRGSSRSRARR